VFTPDDRYLVTANGNGTVYVLRADVPRTRALGASSRERGSDSAWKRILVENARRKHRAKRGGQWRRHDLDPEQFHAAAESNELRALHEAMDRLAAAEPQVAELVTLRYFAGLSLPQAAATLGISPRTADRWWAYARAWLLGEVEDGDD
jgi:RNA polymerase sigma factor (TIGR02999 family)